MDLNFTGTDGDKCSYPRRALLGLWILLVPRNHVLDSGRSGPLQSISILRREMCKSGRINQDAVGEVRSHGRYLQAQQSEQIAQRRGHFDGGLQEGIRLYLVQHPS